MKASRILISSLAAAGIVGLAGMAVAQTTTTTAPGATTTTTPGATTGPSTTTTTVTPPTITSTTETETQRMNRERMDRERMNAPGASGIRNATSSEAPMGTTERRDSSGNLIARADRN
jgi:hypothetical protein